MGENVIELKNVRKEFVTTKHYPGWSGAVKGLFTKEKEKKIAVNDVSLEIKKGDIVGYIGSNGAGSCFSTDTLDEGVDVGADAFYIRIRPNPKGN